MSILEKILEEIEEKKEKALNVVKTEINPIEIAIHREQYKGLRMAEDIIRKHISENDGWIPVYQEMDDKDLPNNGEIVLVSFENFDFPGTARYEKDEDGGAFFMEETDSTYSEYGMFVNAWQPLPKPYKPNEEDDV